MKLFYINPKEYRKERKSLLIQNIGWKEFMECMFLQALLQPQSQRGVPTSFFHLSVDTAIEWCKTSLCSAVGNIGKN